MAAKESLHLGQVVLVGGDRVRGVIDGLTQTFAGVILDDEGYALVSYEEIWEE